MAKLGIAGREWGLATERDAEDFARHVEKEARENDWIRVLYNVQEEPAARLPRIGRRRTA